MAYPTATLARVGWVDKPSLFKGRHKKFSLMVSTCDMKAGFPRLQHIIERHAGDFAKRGISKDQIPSERRSAILCRPFVKLYH